MCWRFYAREPRRERSSERPQSARQRQLLPPSSPPKASLVLLDLRGPPPQGLPMSFASLNGSHLFTLGYSGKCD